MHTTGEAQNPQSEKFGTAQLASHITDPQIPINDPMGFSKGRFPTCHQGQTWMAGMVRRKGGIGVAAELRMKLEAMVSAAQFLATQGDELQAELDAITRDWRELSSTWTGVAASAFDPPWDEWHWGAKTVTAICRNARIC